MTFDASGAITEFTLSDRPEMAEYGGPTFPMTDEAIASWSSDLDELIGTYRNSTQSDQAPGLIIAFLIAHGFPANRL